MSMPSVTRSGRASIVPTWAGVNIGEVSGDRLGQPVVADNKSNCAAIAEMMWGAAQGCDGIAMPPPGGR